MTCSYAVASAEGRDAVFPSEAALPASEAPPSEAVEFASARLAAWALSAAT
jgi:hypothetical protein